MMGGFFLTFIPGRVGGPGLGGRAIQAFTDVSGRLMAALGE